MRKDPKSCTQSIFRSLGLEFDISEDFFKNLYPSSVQKIVDVRDISRPMVKKARTSNEIHPLNKEYKFNPEILPLKSQQHLQDIIPIYLDLLYASEHVAMPSLLQLDEPVLVRENI